MRNIAVKIALSGLLALFLCSCSIKKQIAKTAHTFLLNARELKPAHIGIAIYDPVKKEFLFKHQADKFYTPASNTKLFTLYAGLRYLGDSLTAARYKVSGSELELQATGDPTFLHPDFKEQPLLRFLQQTRVKEVTLNTPFYAESYGRGWAWDDFEEPYMAERDPFPMYGNVLKVAFEHDTLKVIPRFLKPMVIGEPVKGRPWDIHRKLGTHFYLVDTTKGSLLERRQMTLATERGGFAHQYLADTLHKPVSAGFDHLEKRESTPIYSQPSDSLFKIMMHRSDNFFAEQTLLMAADEHIGEMNDVKMLDTMLNSDLAGLPQRPRWIDGSGLSRYNLFTPEDFIWLLEKLEKEFGIARLKTILPGVDEGTLEGLYKGYSNHIYAKTGTLSNNLALSGYLFTGKNKPLLFSILVNNHTSSAPLIRRHIESFLISIIKNN